MTIHDGVSHLLPEDAVWHGRRDLNKFPDTSKAKHIYN